MPWTTPRSWVDDETVSAALMNTELTSNMNEIEGRIRRRGQAIDQFSSNKSTSSSSFVTLSSMSMTTLGGDILVGLNGALITSTARQGTFAVQIDSGTVEEAVSLQGNLIGENGDKVSACDFLHLMTNVAAGSHTVKILWKEDDSVSGRSLTLQSYGQAFAIEQP